ncbi:Angiopoietin-related protein 7 [Holothuria leucospilota]|uniref:Angiopoietin-related protein 7 n=1 Tax=Holothuria leucospilota TaxID=206669 RepID=A0A9Q1BWK5_HOLLE|nr:Angiopoietin-related protein 7 [Holothuria leucospilota]
MKNNQHSYKTALLLLLTSLLSIEGTSTQEGSSYFFYQQPKYPRDCKEARDQCSSNDQSGVYTVKPDGYPEPFEVYCNNDISSGGWTVIQRRIDGTLTFQRNWEDYASGFGFLSGEFWIGNGKLSYLTNQAVYELRIDITLSNGSSFFVKYNSFRTSDEWGDFTIVAAENFRSNLSCLVSTCPPTLIRGTCSCHNVCTDPIGQTDCYTECTETCVPEGCLVPETNTYISNGESFINAGCTQNCTCVNNQLSCNTDYECSSYATCAVRDETRKCYCNDRYEGDGKTCLRNTFIDCYDAHQSGYRTDGVYTIQPTGWTRPPFTVFCDMTTAGGGWTVIQRRTDGVTNFYKTWNEYQNGFGSRDAGNDYWLGNEQIHSLTNQKGYKLRVDIVTSGGSPKYAEYTSFQIGDVSTKYRLSIGSYSGNAGNYLYYNNGKQFSTRDEDNDGCSNHDFAERHKGGWWYTNYWCTNCYGSYCYHFAYGSSGCYTLGTVSNLNGEYSGGNGKNIFWYYYNCNLNSAEMKIRPSSV